MYKKTYRYVHVRERHAPLTSWSSFYGSTKNKNTKLVIMKNYEILIKTNLAFNTEQH